MRGSSPRMMRSEICSTVLHCRLLRRVGVELGEVLIFARTRQPGAFEGVAGELNKLLRSEFGFPLRAFEILVHVAAEIGRIVRMHGGAYAEIEHALDLLGLAAVGDEGVGDRADGE